MLDVQASKLGTRSMNKWDALFVVFIKERQGSFVLILVWFLVNGVVTRGCSS